MYAKYDNLMYEIKFLWPRLFPLSGDDNANYDKINV